MSFVSTQRKNMSLDQFTRLDYNHLTICLTRTYSSLSDQYAVLRGILTNTVSVTSNQVRAIRVHTPVELAESAHNDAIRRCDRGTCIACKIVSIIFEFVDNKQDGATKQGGRWRRIPCFCKCHFVHDANVPD